MCFVCVFNVFLSRMGNISSTPLRTFLSASSTRSEHPHHSSLCCSAHFMDCNGRCKNLDGSHKASQEPLLILLMSFNLPVQRHHQHRRVALLQRTYQNLHPAGGEHVPHGGWCTRPQDLSPTQGERLDPSEVPELPLRPRPGPPGTSVVGQTITFIYLFN